MFNFLNKIFPKKFNDRKLAEETFCIIDTETTGLEVRSGDKIISFAGVKVKSFKLLDAIFDQLIDPERDVPSSSSKIHGIYQKDIVGKPKIREIEHDISNFISNCTIVGHNIQFDQDFVETIIPYSELALKFKLNPILDTFSLAISLFPDLESHELSDLCKTFKIKPEIRHTALGDSIMTANLFVILAREAQERGAKSVYDLIKIMNKSIEISKHLKKNKHY
ncbi:MAG: PolC-type DNA polymerase III [Pelagibacteraceae bacterium]|jgi:DNA polymerase-3 subunit epsilon